MGQQEAENGKEKLTDLKFQTADFHLEHWTP